MVTCGLVTSIMQNTKILKMKHLKISVLEFLKYLFSDKETLLIITLFIITTPIYLYSLTINFHWWDTILLSLSFLVGWRFSKYGLYGLIPGGGFIADRHYHTIRFWSELKKWKHKWMFLSENNFSVDFYYRKKEMYKGDPTSVREVTGPSAVTIGIGFNKYIFDLE